MKKLCNQRRAILCGLFAVLMVVGSVWKVEAASFSMRASSTTVSPRIIEYSFKDDPGRTDSCTILQCNGYRRCSCIAMVGSIVCNLCDCLVSILQSLRKTEIRRRKQLVEIFERSIMHG